MAPASSQWLDTALMSSRLGIHPKTLLRLRRETCNPFVEGTHYRRGGLSEKAPIQWNPEATDFAFTSFRRMPASSVEVFSRASSGSAKELGL